MLPESTAVRSAGILPPAIVHPIFTAAPVTVNPVFTPSPSPNPGSSLIGGVQSPIHASTGQNVAAGSNPTQAFANGTAPVLYSTELGYGSVGTPGSAISSSSTVSSSPSFESESNVASASGAPNTSEGGGTAASIESAVQSDLPGGALLSSLPTWFWFLAGALILYLWYTGESPREVVNRVT